MLLDRIKVCFLSKTFQILKKVLYFCMFYHVDKFPQDLFADDKQIKTLKISKAYDKITDLK